MEEDYQYEGAEEYSSKDMSFKTICLEHLRRITNITCNEFRGGYWKEVPTKTSVGMMTMSVYVPDTRAQFINGVNGLYDLLVPRLDAEFIKEFEEIQKEAKELIREFNKESNIIYTKRNKEEPIYEEDFRFLSEGIKNIKDVKVEIARMEFRALNKLLYRLKYLDRGEIKE